MTQNKKLINIYITEKNNILFDKVEGCLIDKYYIIADCLIQKMSLFVLWITLLLTDVEIEYVFMNTDWLC